MTTLPRALTDTLSARIFQQHLVAPLQRVVAEFLRSAPQLYLRGFPKFAHLDPATLPLEVLCGGCVNACRQECASDDETTWAMSAFLCVQWLEDHLAMYDVAEPCLRDALGDYERLDAAIPLDVSRDLVRRLVQGFGALAAFVFCVLSSVRLHGDVFAQLRADADAAQRALDDEVAMLQHSVSSMLVAGDRPPTLSPSASSTRTLSRSLGDMESAENSPSPLLGAQRRPWQLMARSASVSSVVRARRAPTTDAAAASSSSSTSSSSTSSSSSSSLVTAMPCRGWLEKLRGVTESTAQLIESAADMDAAGEQRWKRRWVQLEDGKFSWFAAPDAAADQRGCVPLHLVSSIRTHPELGPTAFAIKCGGHLVQFVFRAASEDDMTRWLWALQQWLVVRRAARQKGAAEPAAHTNILAVGRWWKKLKFDRKSSLESFLATTERDAQQSVLGNVAVATESHRPHVAPSTRRALFEAACVATTQGQRPTMEDAHIACPEITAITCKWGFTRGAGGGGASLFAVFDGHGGCQAALFCRDQLGPVLAQCCPTFGALDLRDAADCDTATRALRDCFARLDAQFLEGATDALLPHAVLAGSTALVVVLHEHTLAVANLGDSRAVLCRGGQCVALSVDHKPNETAERERIVAAGGWITEAKVLDVSKLWRLNPRLLLERAIPLAVGDEIGFVTSYRVLGELSVSRAIGDAETKEPLRREYWPEHHFSGDVVSCEPDVRVVVRDAARDEFVLMACDGFWDVIESPEAVALCSQRLRAHLMAAGASLSASVESPSGKHALPSHSSGVHSAVKATADDLVQEALRRGSLDNVSLVLIVLAAALPPVVAAGESKRRLLFV